MSTETEPTEAEATAELAKPTDISEYVAERQEQEAQDAPPADEVDALARQVRDTDPSLKEAKKASRYERLKRARDQYKGEADAKQQRIDELEQKYERGSETQDSTPESSERAVSADEARLESSLESARLLYGGAFDQAYQAFVEHCTRTGDKAAYESVMNAGDVGQALVQWHDQMGNPSAPEGYNFEAAMQQGRQQQEFAQQLAARDAEIRTQAELSLRVEAFARECSDFHEVMQAVEGVDEVPPVMLDLIRKSPVAPDLIYLMAKDYWELDSKGYMDHAQTLANDPIAQARYVGALEQVVYATRNKNGGMSPAVSRATKAPPPLTPIRGGASAPKDLHSLAKSDSADDYIRARRSSPS